MVNDVCFNVDAIKNFKETEKDEVHEAKHNFEAEIYLEKLDHETEKVGFDNYYLFLGRKREGDRERESSDNIRLMEKNAANRCLLSHTLENRAFRQQRHLGHIFSAPPRRRAHPPEQSGQLLERLHQAQQPNDQQQLANAITISEQYADDQLSTVATTTGVDGFSSLPKRKSPR